MNNYYVFSEEELKAVLSPKDCAKLMKFKNMALLSLNAGDVVEIRGRDRNKKLKFMCEKIEEIAHETIDQYSEALESGYYEDC